MTDSEWLKYKARVTGKTVEEIRQDMRERSAKADKSKAGFAALPPELRRKLGQKGGRISRRRKTNPERRGKK